MGVFHGDTLYYVQYKNSCYFLVEAAGTCFVTSIFLPRHQLKQRPHNPFPPSPLISQNIFFFFSLLRSVGQYTPPFLCSFLIKKKIKLLSLQPTRRERIMGTLF